MKTGISDTTSKFELIRSWAAGCSTATRSSAAIATAAQVRTLPVCVAGASWTLYVCACWHDSFVELRLASRVPVSSSVSSWLARGIAQSPVARRGCSRLSRACRLGSRCAVRCFRCLWVWGVLVAIIKLAGFLVGLRLRASPSGFAFDLRASPSGFAFDLRASPSGFAFFGLRLRPSPSGFAVGLRASPSGPPEAKTRLRTHGRCPGSFPDSPQNTHDTPRSYVVFAAESRRAVFWSASCATRSDPPPTNSPFGPGDDELLVRASAVLKSQGAENWSRGRPGLGLMSSVWFSARSPE